MKSEVLLAWSRVVSRGLALKKVLYIYIIRVGWRWTFCITAKIEVYSHLHVALLPENAPPMIGPMIAPVPQHKPITALYIGCFLGLVKRDM